MPALSAGVTAPDFNLATMEAKEFSLSEALKRGPVLLVFFKISCPVCQFTLPYVERLYQEYRNAGVSIVAVSQNNKKDTDAFNKEYGITLPVLSDELDSYPVSNAYGLTNVPTLFWIASDGEIELSSVGWSRKDMEEINRRLAETANAKTAILFRNDEFVPEFRAG